MNLLNDTVGNDYGMINDEEKEIKNTNIENQEENKDIVNDSLSNVTEFNVNDDKFKTEEIEVINDIKSENLSEEVKESNNSEIVNEVSEGVFEPEIESNIADNKVEEAQANYEYEKNVTLNESKLDEVESNNDKKSLIDDKDISFEEKY